MDPGFERLELVARQPAATDLVGEGGIREAVAHHPAPGRQRRLDAGGEMFAARGEHQHGLGFQVHRLVQQQFAQTLAERRAAGFARLLDIDAAGAQQFDGGGDLAALARAIDAFEGDEAPARRLFAAARGLPVQDFLVQGLLPDLPALRMKRFTA